MIIGLKVWTLESTQAKKFQRGKILKVGLLWSHVSSCDPRDGANIDPMGII